MKQNSSKNKIHDKQLDFRHLCKAVCIVQFFLCYIPTTDNHCKFPHTRDPPTRCPV